VRTPLGMRGVLGGRSPGGGAPAPWLSSTYSADASCKWHPARCYTCCVATPSALVTNLAPHRARKKGVGRAWQLTARCAE